MKKSFVHVLPAKAGIQNFDKVTRAMDPGFLRGDDLAAHRQTGVGGQNFLFAAWEFAVKRPLLPANLTEKIMARYERFSHQTGIMAKISLISGPNGFTPRFACGSIAAFAKKKGFRPESSGTETFCSTGPA